MPKFHVKTWGCQVNSVDTEQIKRIFTENGWEETKALEEVDVLILNTCSVRQRAEDKTLGIGIQVSDLKDAGKDIKVVLTGCMAQRYKRDACNSELDLQYIQKLKKGIDWIDEIVAIEDWEGFEKLAKTGKRGKAAIVQKVTAYVPISTGCDNFCTYCVVPFSRGKEVSRDFREIENEVKELVQSGCRQITLLGQNVNSWKGEIDGRSANFPELLESLAKISGDFWITFLTSHPKDLSSDLVSVMKKFDKKICPYLNLPLQSGSDAVLKRMNRHYSYKQYFDLIELVKKEVPEIRLSTDIIVGFPGESEVDFEKSKLAIKECGFEMVYISEYSPRPGTASFILKDNVTPAEKKHRKLVLEDLVRNNIIEQNKSAVGQKLEVLVLSIKMGKTFDQREVKFTNCSEKLVGTFVTARITGYSTAGLEGEIIV